MESPFRSEAAAFRFLLLTIVGFALIVAASWLNPWLGLLVFLGLSGAATWLYFSRRAEPLPPERLLHHGHPDERRVLVVANETVAGDELMRAIGETALEGRSQFHVVCPALNSRLRTWTSDEDPARAAAQTRLDATLAHLSSVGIEARGAVGDADPLVAVEDAVRTFHPDELIVSTHPEGRSNWLERGVVEALRQRYDVPLRHVVVKLERDPV
jgi:hypothetical protein